jgi:hypothetical protein
VQARALPVLTVQPVAWSTPEERQRANLARARAAAAGEETRAELARQVAAVQATHAGDLGADAPDSRIREAAQRRADQLIEAIAARPASTPEALQAWLAVEVERRGGKLPPFDLAGIIARVTCRLWWRRQLRRLVVRQRETEAMQAGEVARIRRQVYVTDDTVRRKAQRSEANAAMLADTWIEAADGECITLAQAAAASVANKAIRRGELMTRIRGCEEWATAAGMVGLFTTNTAPSRFHAQHWKGGRNHRHSGDESQPGAGNYGPMRPNTPRDAQRWLCATWARTRAALKREGVEVFGFRVAEPHHDGCPHWHMLLWARPEHIMALQATVRRYWLAENGDEPGASEHRVKFEPIRAEAGGAVAYVAKYIAKNIDDVGALEAEGHKDQRAGEQGDLFGATARRVEAWASAWSIRQFQAIGQPPVTVWRELRRVTEQAAAGGTANVKAAHAAVNRAGERRADWRAYMDAQGGAMKGRDYAVRLVNDDTQREGRYGPSDALRPLGVIDAARPEEWILSDRREWKPRGGWTKADKAEHVALWRACANVTRSEQASAKRAQPWTRVNNCTRRGGPAFLLSAGLVGIERENRGPGGPQHRKHPPPCPVPSPKSPAS